MFVCVRPTVGQKKNCMYKMILRKEDDKKYFTVKIQIEVFVST